MKTLLLCQDELHAEVVNALVLESLRDNGVVAGAWSDIYTDGERFGIIWVAPVSDIFGSPEDVQSGLVVVEDADDSWEVVLPEPPAPEVV